jgi:MerR family transcriptional regulator, light-induced transcriptional regulator
MDDKQSPQLEAFTGFLDRLDREGALDWCQRQLAGGMGVPELYEQILAPALNRIVIGRQEEHDQIWREHVLSNIVRSVIENALPYVLRERDAAALPGPRPRALLACPEQEYHELGIRMGADFFTMAGFDVTYIGCNTPLGNILSAARTIKPHVICLGVTNYLNLSALLRIIPELKRLDGFGGRILLSGSALRHTGRGAAEFGADGFVASFADIQELRRNFHENSR